MALLLLMALGNPAAAAEGYFSLTRTEILQIFRLSEVTEITGQASQAVPAGDELFVAGNDPRGIHIMLVGHGEKIHSMRVMVPLVNMSAKDDDDALKDTGTLLEKLSPQWLEARKWPVASLKDAWTATANSMKAAPSDLNALVPTKTSGDVTVSTFGVPPDLIIYHITTRAACVPRMDPAKPRELPMRRIC